MKLERLRSLFAEYGRIAVITYFALFVLSLAVFAVLISFGFEVKSATGTAGLLGAAWVGTKVIQPFRIAGAIALTPLVARIARGPLVARLLRTDTRER